MTTTRIVFSTAVLLLVLGSAIILASVTQAAGPVFGPPAALSTNATTDSAPAQCNGNMGVRAYFAPGLGPQDIKGLRYKFHAADNNQAGLDLKILFGFMRFYTPGAIDTYLLESNLYTRGLLYSDPTCTNWPLLGMLVGSETSLRLAVPDYMGLGKAGAKTFAPLVFPRQSYLIDGLTIPKTDAISQLNLNQMTTEVMITRGGLVSDKTDWKCVGSLDADTYRQWDASATVGSMIHNVSFALPDSNARFITSDELINFRTEFYLFPGLFKVYLWDFQLMRESTGSWEPLTHWIVDDQCGDVSAYGVRLASFEGRTVMEISNDGPGSFLPVGTIFDLSFLFYTVNPCRVVDTRNADGPLGGPALVALQDRTFPVAGACGIPPTAKALSVNITVTQPTTAGHLRLHAGGTPVPWVSAINYISGRTRANNAIVTVSSSGEIAVYVGQASGLVHFILDVNGYFQ